MLKRIDGLRKFQRILLQDSGDREMNKKLFKRISLCMFLIIIVFTSSMCLQFTKNNIRIIMWDYRLVCDAFGEACVQLETRELSDVEILSGLAEESFVYMWQIRDLSKPLTINSKLYSKKLYDYLFDCMSSESLSQHDVKKMLSILPDIYENLNQIDWENIQMNGNWFFHKADVLKTIHYVDRLIC